MRPLTAAVAAAGRGKFVLDGVARMRERPIQDLVDGLVQLGVDAKCSMGTGCPPVEINAQGLRSGKVEDEQSEETTQRLLHICIRSGVVQW
jgi:3-phosphoshikimate 1-carboxyvinyltransferase